MKTKLETALDLASAITPSAEADIDLLRSILLKEVGTKAQRAALIRIIRQVSPRKPVSTRLFQHFDPDFRRLSYF